MKRHKQLVFEKVYTRDNNLLIQEIWSKGFLTDVYGRKNPFLPPIIYYINDGMAEVWENKQSLSWYKNSLLKMNRHNPEFFYHSIKEYPQLYRRLTASWKKEHAASVKELKNFITLLIQGTELFLIFYFSAIDERTPAKIRRQGLKMREKDMFYDNSHEFLQKSLNFFYPKLKNENFAILLNELNQPPKKEILNKRLKNFVLIPGKFSSIMSLDKFLKKNKYYKFIFDKITNKKFIKGQTAYKGKAKGYVRILKKKNSYKDFKKGEILVSPMTAPILMTAIKKAAAIVTDEGGITCHAAIIARELKIPCIIGTKIATKVLKDDDYIEVDANKGIIRKIR